MKKYVTPSFEVEVFETSDIMSISNGVNSTYSEEGDTLSSILGIDKILGNK